MSYIAERKLYNEHGWDLGLERGKKSVTINNRCDERLWKDSVFY